MKFQAIKQIFALLMVGFVSTTMQITASPITRQQAQQNALSFMQERGKSVAISSLRHAPMRAAQPDELQPYYVFNIDGNHGYVIASGDDCAYAVLGYSDEGTIDLNNLPCNLQAWLDGYAQDIKYLQEHGASPARASKKADNRPAIAPLLTCHWGQGYPYNMFCPIDPTTGQQCVTGCVATAMAQVMYYHRARSAYETTYEIPAYATSTLGINVDAIPAGSFIDWDNMIDSYDDSYPIEVEQAVANLMKYCGAAVKMDYTSAASAAAVVNIDIAFLLHFHYSSKTRSLYRSSYSSENWEDLIYSELNESRPVCYGGDAPDQGGHEFVCDGYDGNGFYHINWGWGGFGDGYFALTMTDLSDELLPYSNNNHALINAQPRASLPNPDSGIHFADPIMKLSCLLIGDTNDDGALSMEEAASITDFGIPMLKLKYLITSFEEFKYFTGVTTISDRAFESSKGLTNIKIPNSVTTIGNFAFRFCRGLRNIIIPSSVTVIGDEAFDGCDSLSSVTCFAMIPPEMNGIGFPYDFDTHRYKIETLRVPIEAVDAYKSKYSWNRFRNIVGIDPSLGDSNLDGVVNIADINRVINSILGDGNDYMSDVNRDGNVNIGDVNAIINIIFNEDQ